MSGSKHNNKIASNSFFGDNYVPIKLCTNGGMKGDVVLVYQGRMTSKVWSHCIDELTNTDILQSFNQI